MKRGKSPRLALYLVCLGAIFSASAQSTDPGKPPGSGQATPAAATPAGTAPVAKPDDEANKPDTLSMMVRTLITVTASRTPDEAGDIPQSLNTVNAEMLAQRQPATPNALLREEVGIFSPQVGTQGSPIIRGQMGNRVL